MSSRMLNYQCCTRQQSSKHRVCECSLSSAFPSSPSPGSSNSTRQWWSSYNKLENSSQDIRIDWIIRCWCKADLDLMCAAKNSSIIHLSTTEWDAETTGQLCRGEDWVIAEVSSTDQKCLHVLQDIGGEGDSTTQESIPPEI